MSTTESLLKTMGTGQEYFKGGFLGFNGSGKTATMVFLACGIRRFFKLPGPIAMYDSEGGSDHVAPIVKHLTGLDMIGVKARSLDTLAQFTTECVAAGVSVAVAESMTHPWRELCEAYLGGVNEARAKNGKAPRRYFEIGDWQELKGIWNDRWTSLYLNAPIHLIIAGRAGYEFDEEVDDTTGKTKLVKSGVKMKTEGEFGFEPSLLVEMEADQVREGGGFTLVRTATVRKDRKTVIDGCTFTVPRRDPDEPIEAFWERAAITTFEFFEPHVSRLKTGVYSPINVAVSTNTGADADGDSEWTRERRQRSIYLEEIDGELTAHGLGGQSAEAKDRRLKLLKELFGTYSRTQMESMRSERLKDGLAAIRRQFNPEPERVPAGSDSASTTAVPPEEAERLLKIAAAEGHETRLKLEATPRAALRKEHLGGLDMSAATLDAATVYVEALKDMPTPNGNGRKRKAEPPSAKAEV